MKSIFKEVEFVDGIQEFIEAEYITDLLEKNSNTFQLSGTPIPDSIRFSGDTSLFKKRVYNINDLEITGSWLLTDDNKIKINTSVTTSPYTFTYVTYKSKSATKKEGLFSVDYDKGILYTSTSVKNILITFRNSIQYVEGQQMTQVNAKEYTKDTISNIPVNDNEKLSYIYQIKTTNEAIQSKEFIENGKVSFITLEDKYE